MGYEKEKAQAERDKRKRGRGKGSTAPAPVQWRFINSNFSAEEKRRFSAYYTEDVDVYPLLEVWVTDGIKVSVSFNADTQAFIAAATDKNPDSPNYGCTISSHAKTAHKALAATVWKLEYKWQPDGVWSVATDDPDDFG